MYEYRAVVLNNYDGDTLRLDIDLGFGITKMNEAFRLYGVNTPELRADGGREAKNFVAELLPKGTCVVIRTIKDKKEKYGRYLVQITLPDGRDLTTTLITEGHGVTYFG